MAGGVGGAKLALGLSRLLPPSQLVIAVNTGDDESFHGLHISPDMDTVMYTLAGLSNPETGWGLAGDTFEALSMLERLGAETWFNLGDRDLATHVRRTQLLGQGASLSQVAESLCRSLGVEHRVVPMSDEPVKTVVSTAEGDLPMQQYFVQRRAEPAATGIKYVGSENAVASPSFRDALENTGLLVFCPSNPYLSIGPVLAVPGVRPAIESFRGTRVAVSPIVAGAAVRGPAAKMMSELGEDVSVLGVARQYAGLCDYFFIDNQDAAMAEDLRKLGMTPVVDSIIMNTEEDKTALARRILELAGDSNQ